MMDRDHLRYTQDKVLQKKKFIDTFIFSFCGTALEGGTALAILSPLSTSFIVNYNQPLIGVVKG